MLNNFLETEKRNGLVVKRGRLLTSTSIYHSPSLPLSLIYRSWQVGKDTGAEDVGAEGDCFRKNNNASLAPNNNNVTQNNTTSLIHNNASKEEMSSLGEVIVNAKLLSVRR